LHGQRLIETEIMAHLRHVLGRGESAEDRLRRVAGDERNHQEDDDGDAEQNRRHHQAAT